MTSDLLLALLAMDAYSQGFAKAIPDVGTQIGGARVISTDKLAQPISQELKDALNSAGFAATPYSMNGTGTDLDGAIVISYRGSEDFDDGMNDLGFSLGQIPSQTYLAAKYYFAIKQNYPNARIVLSYGDSALNRSAQFCALSP